MARNTRITSYSCTLYCAKKTAQFLCQPFAGLDSETMPDEAKKDVFHKFLNRYLLILKTLELTFSADESLNTSEVSRTAQINMTPFSYLLSCIQNHLTPEYRLWREQCSELSQLLCAIDLSINKTNFHGISSVNECNFINGMRYLFSTRQESPSFTTYKLYNSLQVSLFTSISTNDIYFTTDFIARKETNQDVKDRAFMAIQALFYYCNKNEKLTQLQLYKEYLRIIKELYFFDENL